MKGVVHLQLRLFLQGRVGWGGVGHVRVWFIKGGECGWLNMVVRGCENERLTVAEGAWWRW